MSIIKNVYCRVLYEEDTPLKNLVEKHKSNLSRSNLHGSNLSESNLSGSNLSGSDLSGSDLRGSDLSGSNLSESDLSGSNLSWSDLSGSDLSGSDLSGSNLSGSNLSRACGLLDPSAWLQHNFDYSPTGILVYKAIGNTYYEIPIYWKIEEGEFIEEVVNRIPTDDCGCGVNFATLDWIKKQDLSDIWVCLIHYRDLPGVIVPYNTDGKARCSRLQLLRKI